MINLQSTVTSAAIDRNNYGDASDHLPINAVLQMWWLIPLFFFFKCDKMLWFLSSHLCCSSDVNNNLDRLRLCSSSDVINSCLSTPFLDHFAHSMSIYKCNTCDFVTLLQNEEIYLMKCFLSPRFKISCVVITEVGQMSLINKAMQLEQELK